MENKESSPQITVLMTVFNGGNSVKRAVQSVLNQTYKNFELLVIDDASTDDSWESINAIRDSRIRIHSNCENLGQAKSLNLGLKLALGQYVARIDADDIALPDWLEHQWAVIKANKEYAVVSTQALVIDERDRVIRIYRSPINREDIILRSFTFSPINHVGSIFNKEIILEEGGYVERYKIAADYGLWSKLIRHGHKITSTDKFLVAIKAHSSSLSQAGSGKRELKDLSEIMRANINCFTNSEITQDESGVFCRAFFSEGTLSNIEFHQAIDLLKRIFGSLSPAFMISRESRQKWLSKRCLAVYLKRINFCIKDKNYAVVRDMVRKGIDEFGVFSPLGMLFVVNSLGRIFLNYVPGIYKGLMKFEACFMAKSKMRMAEL